MEKNAFEMPEVQVIHFCVSDIIATSTGDVPSYGAYVDPFEEGSLL